MSSDSEDLSRPSKKRRYIIEESESSDDSVVIKNNRKRKVFKVVSDVDSSDDDSDVPRPVRRKNGTTKIIVSEDESSGDSDGAGSLQLESSESAWESDWQSTDSSDVVEVLPKKSRVKPKKLDPSPSSSSPKRNDSDSELSDGQTEKCPICLLPFKKQQVATPATCDHCFCLLCLTEWSKNVNTCPVDRQPFTFINVRFHLNGKIVQKIPVETKNPAEEHIQEDPTFCEVCQQCDREDRMLLCDGCDLGFHLECLSPPMDRVPMEEWYCPTCTEINPNLAESIEMDMDELPDLMAEARCLGTTYGRTRSGATQDFAHPPMHTPGPSNRRIIPRTRQTERVRANIRADRRRQQNIRNFDPDQPSTSSGIESIYDSNSRNDLIASVIQRVSAAMSRNGRGRVKSKSTTKKPRRRKTTKKTSSRNNGSSELREVRIREINEAGEEKEIVTYVKVKTSSAKRMTKRTKRTRKKLKRKTTKRRALSSLYGKGVKKRLAITLGLVKGRAKVTSVAEPVVNNQGTVRSGVELTNSRFRAGISQVSLFGNNLGLDYSPPGSDDETMLDSPGLTLGSIVGIRRRNVSISSTRRRLALKGMLLEPRASPPNDQQLQSPLDLLDRIMGSQKLWHSKSNKITLKANGTLLLPSDLEKQSDKDENTNNNINKDLIKRLDDNSNTIIDKKIGQPLDLTNMRSEDITQAPMYNGSRGGGGPRGGGGGGGGRGNNYHGGRDSYYSGGRQNYHSRGPGLSPRGGFGHRERGQSPAMTDFSPNFDNRMNHNFNSSFRFRNSLNYRNDNRPRMPMMPNMPRPPNQMFRGPSDNINPIFPLTQPIFPPSILTQPPPPPPVECPVQNVPHNDYSENMEQDKSDVPVEPSSSTLSSPSLSADKIDNSGGVDAVESSVIEGVAETHGNEEDCDIYADIEARDENRKNQRTNESSEYENKEENEEPSNAGTTSVLLPPPEPPSELLLDLEENLKNDSYETNSRGSDNEDLVIDDTHKEPEREVKEIEKTQTENTETSEPKYYDKYDPFQEADSDEESQADCPNFSIYSSETMDVARRAEEQLSQEIDIGPLEPPPLPPDIPDDDTNPFPTLDDLEPVDPPVEIPVERVVTPDIPEPPPSFDPYVESLRKERQQLSKIPSKKISTDSRGKITFKIGNKSKVMNKLSSLYDEIDDNIETMIEQEKELEASAVEHPSSRNEETPSEDISLSSKIVDEPVEKEPVESPKLSEPQTDKIIDEDDEEEEQADKKISDKSDDEDKEPSQPIDDEEEEPEKLNDSISTEGSERGGTPPIIPNEAKSNSDNCVVSESSDVINEEESILSQDFQLEKDENPNRESEVEKSEEDKNLSNEVKSSIDENIDGWYSDGAYTPCKDENPVVERDTTKAPFESGLEPITPPPKDRNSDDLDRCRTPIGYAGLGTEAISENDEPISFEDDPSTVLSPSTHKDKEIEDGEIIVEEGRSFKKKRNLHSEKDGDREGKKRKERRAKSTSNKDTDKNKENTSDNNQVSWKKLSKSTKERQYREKMKRRSISKERHRDRNRNRDRDRERDRDYDKEKDKNSKKRKSKERAATTLSAKDMLRKKEKRKELPRYDVRKLVAEKPPRPKKDEYGRDIRAVSSRSRSRGRSLGRGKSHSYSPARRSWPRRLSRSWSNHRRRSPSRASRASSRYSRSRSRSRSLRRSRSRSHSRSRSRSRSRSYSRLRSHSRSRSRRKSPASNPRRRSLSRKRSRSASPRRGRRSLSNQRVRKNHQKRLTLRKRKSRSRSRKKEKSKKYKSRSRSRRRKRSWSKSPQPMIRREKEKKRLKRKMVLEKSRSRERSASRNWESMNLPRSLDRGYSMRSSALGGPLTLLSTGMHDSNPMNHVVAQNQSSWSGAQWTPSWSRSKTRSRSRSNGPSLEPVPPKNLTVILTNKEAIKKKKREKRLKEGRKRRDEKKRDKRNRTPPPSKEVFASGDNILVSVCFNNDNMNDNNDKAATSVPNGDSISSQLADTIASLTSKKRKRRNYRGIGIAPIGALSKEPLPKKPKKDKSKDKRGKSPEAKLRGRREKKKKSKAAEIAASKKPVAVIDLDQSPFREQTPSPKAIIVLSDDDDNDLNQQLQQLQQLQNAISPAILHQQQQKSSDTRHDEQVQQQEIQNDNLASQRDEFVGPKTPPEPQIKFSISKQSSNLRPSMMNPLLDEEEDDEDRDNEDGDDDVDDDDDDNTNAQHQKSSDDKDRSSANKSGKSDAKLINELAAELLNSNDQSRENEHTGANDDNIIIVADSNEEELDDLEALEILELNERTHGLSQQIDSGNQGEMDSMKHDRSEERRNQDELEMRLKIGPNTPPEPPTSPPTSPDAYDPFDPTKSRSPTPTASQETSIGIDSALTSNDSMKLSVPQGKENFSNEKRETMDKPKIISMVTIKRASSPSTAGNIINLDKSEDGKGKPNSGISTSSGNPFTTINPVLATVAAAVQRIGIQRNLANAQIKQRTSGGTNQVSNLYMNSVKGMTLRGSKVNTGTGKQNGSEGVEGGDTAATGPMIDTSSPYSPGSSLSDGFFDPPPHHRGPSPPGNILSNLGGGKSKGKTGGKADSKKDAFDALFGTSPIVKSGKSRAKKATRKRTTNSKVGVRMDENELQILDDLPSSAVEMQVKDKFLKKLNRQERVVEEVKLVLKPHYTKKHVTKEEYKDIMRKAVPKICHNKTGEINPKKIAQLVEAYVRKCRSNKRKGTNVNPLGNSMAKILRPAKTLWS